MARLVVSQNERIILHLSELEKYREDAEVPMGACQEGIAQKLQMQVHNVSRTLTSLQAEGLVADRLAHIRGAPKRRRAYFLTEKGRKAAHALRADLGRRRVVIEERGKTTEMSIEDAVRRIGSLTGQTPSLTEIAELARDSDVIPAASLSRPPPTPERAREFVVRAFGRPKVDSFFGREKERKTLTGAFAEDGPAVTLLWGIPGIGKSSLASKAFDELAGKRSVFWYTFREWDTDTSFLLSLEGFIGALGRENTLNAVKRGQGTADLFAPLVEDLSNSDAVLFLDDVHKAARSIDLLMTLLMEAVSASGSAKAVFVSRSVPAFFSPSTPGHLAIEVTGLEREAARQLAESSKATDVMRVVDESHGHPLLLRLMAKGGPASSKGDVISFIEREVYSAVTPPERTVLELLSIYRHPVPVEAIPGGDYSAVSSLRQRALVTEQEGGISTHDLLKEFFASHLGAERKSEHHRAAAAFCEGHPTVEWKLETLYHHVEAKDWANAKRIAITHATELAKEFPEETHSLISRIAVEVLPKRDQAELLYLRGQLSEAFGGLERALKDYGASAALLTAEGDAPLHAAVLESTAKLQSQIERWSESFAAHEKALRIYEKMEDKEGQSREWMNIGGVHRRKGDHTKAREAYSKALSLATMEENRAAQAACFNNLALLDWDEDRLRDAEIRFKESVKLAHAVKDHAGEAKGLENLAELFRTQYKLGEMTTLLWESSEAFRRAGEIDEFKRLQAACAEALGAQGRLGDGIDLCRKALDKPELKRRTGLFQKAPRYDAGDVALSLVMTDLLRRSGDFKGALKEVQRLSSMAEAIGDQALAAKAGIEAALVHEVAGDLQEAMRALNGAEGTLRSLGDSAGLVAVYLRKGTVQEKLGDEAAAAKHYQEAARHAEIANDQYALTVAKDNLRALTGSS